MSVESLLTILRDGRGRYDGEEVVDDLAHAMQTAGLAIVDGADDDMVAAALLHDIGHHPALADRQPPIPHERLGAEVLGPVFGQRAAFAVALHVEAKRHLAASDPDYAAALSPASQESLARQGG